MAFARSQRAVPTAAARAAAFAALVTKVQACQRCPSMEGRLRVLGRANGSLGARVLFVAEAPGRLGADRLGVPLAGDRSGKNFELLLAAAGWRREDVFISNAVLCNPRDDQGRNRPPDALEVGNCRSHLAALIGVLDPAIVVTLGATALRAAGLIEPHTLTLATHVGRATDWNGRTLVPLYHPGARALIWRPLSLQRRDYRRVRRFFDRHLMPIDRPARPGVRESGHVALQRLRQPSGA